MAETKTTKSTKKKNTEDIPELELLKQEIANLKNQLANQKNTQETASTNFVEESSEKMIKFISLMQGTVMLRGSDKRPYEIEGQYNYRYFTETEAKLIVNLMGKYMTEGYVYIDDPQFVKEVGLSNAYHDMLKPEVLQNLFDNQPQTIINIYKSALEGQKKIIINMIIQQQTQKGNVDANILKELGNLAGIDLLSIESQDK